MESQESNNNKDHIFVLCKDYSEFLKYKEEYPNKNCEFITDIDSLRGRSIGRVIRYGRYEERWDYQGIEDQVDIIEAIWEKGRQERDSAKEEKDLEYGIGD